MKTRRSAWHEVSVDQRLARIALAFAVLGAKEHSEAIRRYLLRRASARRMGSRRAGYRSFVPRHGHSC